MTALLLGWSNVMPLNTNSVNFSGSIEIDDDDDIQLHTHTWSLLFLHLFLSSNCFYAIQKYPDNLDKAAELAVSSVQVSVYNPYATCFAIKIICAAIL